MEFLETSREIILGLLKKKESNFIENVEKILKAILKNLEQIFRSS